MLTIPNAIVAATLTRADTFREGLTNATGSVHYLQGNWGSLTLDGPLRIEYFFALEWFPEDVRNDIQLNSRIQFDAEPNQIDTKFLDLPPHTKRPKPKIKNPRLIAVPEVNYNR